MTELVSQDAAQAIKISNPHEEYYSRHCFDEFSGQRFDGRPNWMGTRFNLFPLILDAHGAPWPEAALYLLSKLEDKASRKVGTLADDLTAYRRFIDEEAGHGINWLDFPKDKRYRPTYRYRAHLLVEVGAGALAASTARRKMSTVIGFYRWLINEQVLVPNNPPWAESDRFIELPDAMGLPRYIKTKTTDVRIHVPKNEDPYTECINDGGKLRPLPMHEQQWVIDALVTHGHIELMLAHIFALVTGARIQTVATFKVRHVLARHLVGKDNAEVRVPIGLGTGIDTKNDKQMVLHIPIWFYEALGIYAKSDRATRRRVLAKGGDTPDQYLFLTTHGNPFYQSKADAAIFNNENMLHHAKSGQAVRQLMTDFILPQIQSKHDPNFHYTFHDLRATFGMNLTDEQLKKVARGEITLFEAREFVRTRMGHQSSKTTDDYLQFRGRLKFVRQTNNEYGEHLKNIATKALEGL